MHPSMMPRRKTTIVTSCSIYQRSRRLITRYADQHNLPSQNPELGGIPMQWCKRHPCPVTTTSTAARAREQGREHA
jgi:hypothetical protein